VNESIKIGDDVYIMVVDIRGDKVRLGIEAPLDVSINRMELLKDRDEPETKDGV
jgi:carbon storage regulator